MIRRHDHTDPEGCAACDEARWENHLDRIAEQDEAREGEG